MEGRMDIINQFLNAISFFTISLPSKSTALNISPRPLPELHNLPSPTEGPIYLPLPNRFQSQFSHPHQPGFLKNRRSIPRLVSYPSRLFPYSHKIQQSNIDKNKSVIGRGRQPTDFDANKYKTLSDQTLENVLPVNTTFSLSNRFNFAGREFLKTSMGNIETRDHSGHLSQRFVSFPSFPRTENPPLRGKILCQRNPNPDPPNVSKLSKPLENYKKSVNFASTTSIRPIDTGTTTTTTAMRINSSSQEKLKRLSRSKMDLQAFPYKADKNGNLSLTKSEIIHGSSPKISRHNLMSSCYSPVVSLGVGQPIKSKMNPGPVVLEKDASDHENCEVSDDIVTPVLSELDFLDDYAESNSDCDELLNKGIELLKSGKDLIENSKRVGQLQTETLQDVAEKLQGIVVGELQELKDENYSLRYENEALKDHLLTSGRIAEPHLHFQAEPNFHMEVANKSPVIWNDPQDSYYQYNEDSPSPSFREREYGNSDDINARIATIEDTLVTLMESNSNQLSRFQDRLYRQELRYEETLTKFEEMMGLLSKLFGELKNATLKKSKPKELETLTFIRKNNH